MLGSGLSILEKLKFTSQCITLRLLSDDVFQIIFFPYPNWFKYHKEKKCKTCPKTTRINNRDVARTRIEIKEGYP